MFERQDPPSTHPFDRRCSHSHTLNIVSDVGVLQMGSHLPSIFEAGVGSLVWSGAS